MPTRRSRFPRSPPRAEAVRWDRAADEIVRASMGYAAELLPDGAEIGRLQEQLGRERQLVRLPRELPDEPRHAVRPDRLADHAALRHASGVLRSRARSVVSSPVASRSTCRSSSSQRADFFEEEVGLETTLKRPIVNTRDEPHCDPQKYRRLHVIVGDANMSEVATYLKVGTTAILLAMIEDNELGDEWLLGNPVPAIRQVSHDPTLRRTIILRDGRRATALEAAVGTARAGPQVRAHATDCNRWARRSAPTCSPSGNTCSPGWSAIRSALPTGWTGSPSNASSTASPNATAWSRRRPSSRRSTSSITTFGRNAAWRSRSG